MLNPAVVTGTQEVESEAVLLRVVFIKKTLLGLFSGGAFAIPVIMIALAVFWKKDTETRYIGFRLLYGFLSLLNLSVIIHGAGGKVDVFGLPELFADGVELKGGGAVGGIFGSALHACIDEVEAVEGPVALVTGSAVGIGRAVLLALAADGYDVAVHYRSSAAEAEAVAAEARALGATPALLRADVTVEREAAGLVEAAHARFGRLDVLVNNVGDYHNGPLAELGSDVWHQIIASNLHSTFYTCQRALPFLRRAPGGGRIVNLGYAGAELLKARPNIAPYVVAKAGVILYSKSLALAEAGNGVTVNVVSPGVMENSDTKPLRELPMGRTGRLSELVAAVRYLVSPEAAYTTGVTIEVAGGWNL